MNLSTPLDGVATEGFTGPAYGLADDSAPSSNGKQWYIDSIDGTQPGVNPHTVGRPFTVSVFRPAALKVASPQLSSMSGVVQNAPKNTYKVITRKAVAINDSGAYAIALVTTTIDIPVGSSDNDIPAIKAALSCHSGSLIQDQDQWWETAVTGAL